MGRMVRIDEQIRFEVSFDPADRVEGFDDDIRFTMDETTTASLRVFAADETSILPTPDQTERFGLALPAAAGECCCTSLLGLAPPAVERFDSDAQFPGRLRNRYVTLFTQTHRLCLELTVKLLSFHRTPFGWSGQYPLFSVSTKSDQIHSMAQPAFDIALGRRRHDHNI